MKSAPPESIDHPWVAHSLVHDFRVEDIWPLPIDIAEHQNIEEVQTVFVDAISQIGKRGPAGMLFEFRNWLGKVFHWEDDPEGSTERLPGLLKKRYAESLNCDPEDLPNGGFSNFHLVYLLPNESLLEIENKTVQAAIHFGKIIEANHCKAVMTIYVKPNGWFGQAYMLAILPFRHWIVYPTLLKALASQWKNRFKR